MSNSYIITAILIMALVTYIPRMLPITVFKKKIESTFIQSVLYYVPFAVLSALTIPDILTSTSQYETAIIGTIIACVLAYFEKNLVVVASGAILAVFLSSFFF